MENAIHIKGQIQTNLKGNQKNYTIDEIKRLKPLYNKNFKKKYLQKKNV